MPKNNPQIEENMDMAEDAGAEEHMDEAVIENEDELEASAEAEDEVTGEQAEAAEEQSETAEDVSEEDLVMTLDDVRLVEAMLFASSSALTESQIAERFPPARIKLIPDVLEHLREHYAMRGVNLVQRDKRWALRTSTDLADSLRLEKEQPKKFTRAAMETMAVIAYHQPVTRAEIENIRGVATSPGALDALMEAGWIKPGKRREVPGRPVTWLSTQAFLDHFGLEKLGDLPGMDDLKAAGLLDKRPAIEAMPTADMFEGEDGRNDAEDPQEVTDEDLIGKSALHEGDEELDEETADAADEAGDDADEDSDDWSDDEDSDEDNEDDAGDEDDDFGGDDEGEDDASDADDMEDDGDEDGDEDGDDDSDEDDSDDDEDSDDDDDDDGFDDEDDEDDEGDR